MQGNCLFLDQDSETIRPIELIQLELLSKWR